MTTFDHDDEAEPLPAGGRAAERHRAHAAEVMADLAGATNASLDTLPEELPVEALVACGSCRLYGAVSPQVDFPIWLAVAGARRIASLLEAATEDANNLPATLADLLAEEAEAAVASLVPVRLDSGAAMIQLQDVVDQTASDFGAVELEAAFDLFVAALDRFDRAIFDRQTELGRLAGTRLLTNFRAMLSTDHREPLPWWLDGRIEDGAIDALVDETLREPPGS